MGLCVLSSFGGIGNRGWQWRLENGAMEWDLLAGSTDNDFKPLLPTTGPDTAQLNAWYHVAVTFTGQSPTNGDQANVLPTDTQKNTVYAFALERGVSDIETYALALARHFVATMQVGSRFSGFSPTKPTGRRR